MDGPTRDFVGYGQHPPDPRWPGGARLALSFVLNYEEGGEHAIPDGDDYSETMTLEVIGAHPVPGRRVLHFESMYEYGSRVGFWRVHRLFTGHGVPLTVFAVGKALERNPEAARAMADAGWEVIGHGWRWIDYGDMSEEEEREHIRLTNQAIERLTGQRPEGWFTGRASAATRRLAVAEGALYDSDSFADELPYWVAVEGRPHLVVPYSLDANDFKFALDNGFVTGDQFERFLVDTFDQLYEEGATMPRLMSVGLHCRMIGKPGRARALGRFLEHVARHPDVWVTTRAEVARHWRTAFPPPPAGELPLG